MSANNNWSYDWGGREFTLAEYKFKVETQLTEWVDDVLAQRHVLTLAHYLNESIPVMLKIRYELNPKNFPLVDDIAQTKRIGERHVLFEASLYDVIHRIGHGPKVMMVTRRNQMQWMPYPGRQIFFTVLRRVPGEDVSKIRNSLSAPERQSIRSQLAKILETMADKNRILRTADLSFLRWDRFSNKLYLVDLTHWAYQIVQDEITINSPFVLEFGLWSDRDLVLPENRENLPFRQPEQSGAVRRATTIGTVRGPRKTNMIYVLE